MSAEVPLEVLYNRFQAIVENMSHVIERTAYATFIKETADFSCGVVATSGEYVAYPWNLGAPGYLGTNMKALLDYFPSYEPGDVIICNDPYLIGQPCTHLPDVHVVRPIFVDGVLLAWAYAFIHASDFGGAVPASVWPRAREIYQEGVRLRPTKLYRAGELNSDVLNLILDNTRIPDTNRGDLAAMCAGLEVCEQQVQEAVRRFGPQTVADGIDRVLDHGEARARRLFEEIPDGSYRFVDYLEDDLYSDVPVRIEVELRVSGSDVVVDFEGTDPQVSSALNMAGVEGTNSLLCLALVGYLTSRDADLPKCSSILRPVTLTAPAGTLVSAQHPAAIGVRYATAIRVGDAVYGALAQALPGQIPACSSGSISPVVAAVPRHDTGERLVEVVQPILGGGGARPDADGLDAAESTYGGFMRNTPVESCEAALPIVVRRYGLVPDTGGAGRYRGGLAMRLDFEALHVDTEVTGRGLERFGLAPWGVAGGQAGTTGHCVVHRGGESTEIGKFDLLRMGPGDVVSIVSAAGAGYGAAMERPVPEVLSDVERGLLSEEYVEQAYGVVVRNGLLDETATAALRSGDAARAGAFDLGSERAALEARWPDDVQAEVRRMLLELPIGVRDWAKHEAYRRYQERGTDNEIRVICDRILSGLRPVPA
ncbi:hydantoinase B/oxoprolinase family protein [Kribbella sp. NPDC004536]|uniref:hydantoinase B/oxoprolinase family protein n=1 Tax=Kribbella sp. NPDC004536 TaxID=3364106 RepID=UPI0036AF1D94